MYECCNGCTERWVDVVNKTRCHSTCPHYAKDTVKHQMAMKVEKDANLLAKFHEGGAQIRVFRDSEKVRKKMTPKKSIYSRY